MGNHEYNAICFHYKNISGGHLRAHTIKNILQHYETLLQFHNNQDLYNHYIEWFLTLPLFVEFDSFRAVHACWDSSNMELLKSKLVNNRLTKELVYESTLKGTAFHIAVNETLKGKECKLPEGCFVADKEHNMRSEIRVRWWDKPAVGTAGAVSVHPLGNFDNLPVDIGEMKFYDEEEKPVFFGHYWFNGVPLILKENVCCVDYSIANSGSLCAYSYDGEPELENFNLTTVH
jgi:hypothetical protein